MFSLWLRMSFSLFSSGWASSIVLARTRMSFTVSFSVSPLMRHVKRRYKIAVPVGEAIKHYALAPCAVFARYYRYPAGFQRLARFAPVAVGDCLRRARDSAGRSSVFVGCRWRRLDVDDRFCGNRLSLALEADGPEGIPDGYCRNKDQRAHLRVKPPFAGHSRIIDID